MRTRTRSSEDSLELLLDTICNVFGGIIFIAILVALLTSSRQHQAMESLPPESGELVPVHELVEAQFRVDQFMRAIDELTQSVVLLSDEGATQSLASINAIRAVQQEADDRWQALERWIAAFERMQQEQDRDLAAKLEDARARQQQLQTALAAVEKQQTVELRLPMARRTTKAQVIVLLKGGRAYVVPLGPAATRLIVLMQQGLAGNAAELARQFNVAERTIYRDLEVLTSLGISYGFDEEAGGYRIGKDFFLPPLHLSPDEALALLALAQTVGQSDQIPFTGPAARPATGRQTPQRRRTRTDIALSVAFVDCTGPHGSGQERVRDGWRLDATAAAFPGDGCRVAGSGPALVRAPRAASDPPRRRPRQAHQPAEPAAHAAETGSVDEGSGSNHEEP